MSNRETYIAQMKSQLDTLDTEMDKLAARAKEARADAGEKYQQELQKLRVQSKSVVEKFEEIKAAGEDSWEKRVSETEKVRDAFVHSIHYFKSQL